MQKPKSLQSSQDVFFPGDEEEAEDYCDCIGNYNLRNRRANTIDSSTSGIAQWPSESLVPIVSGPRNALTTLLICCPGTYRYGPRTWRYENVSLRLWQISRCLQEHPVFFCLLPKCAEGLNDHDLRYYRHQSSYSGDVRFKE